MDCEKLIELVRNHSIFFDTTDANYMTTKLKDELWEKIGASVKDNRPDAIYYKWNSIFLSTLLGMRGKWNVCMHHPPCCFSFRDPAESDTSLEPSRARFKPYLRRRKTRHVHRDLQLKKGKSLTEVHKGDIHETSTDIASVSNTSASTSALSVNVTGEMAAIYQEIDSLLAKFEGRLTSRKPRKKAGGQKIQSQGEVTDPGSQTDVVLQSTLCQSTSKHKKMENNSSQKIKSKTTSDGTRMNKDPLGLNATSALLHNVWKNLKDQGIISRSKETVEDGNPEKKLGPEVKDKIKEQDLKSQQEETRPSEVKTSISVGTQTFLKKTHQHCDGGKDLSFKNKLMENVQELNKASTSLSNVEYTGENSKNILTSLIGKENFTHHSTSTKSMFPLELEETHVYTAQTNPMDTILNSHTKWLEANPKKTNSFSFQSGNIKLKRHQLINEESKTSFNYHTETSLDDKKPITESESIFSQMLKIQNKVSSIQVRLKEDKINEVQIPASFVPQKNWSPEESNTVGEKPVLEVQGSTSEISPGNSKKFERLPTSKYHISCVSKKNNGITKKPEEESYQTKRISMRDPAPHCSHELTDSKGGGKEELRTQVLSKNSEAKKEVVGNKNIENGHNEPVFGEGTKTSGKSLEQDSRQPRAELEKLKEIKKEDIEKMDIPQCVELMRLLTETMVNCHIQCGEKRETTTPRRGFEQNLKKLRSDHLQHIQMEVKHLEEIDRCLEDLHIHSSDILKEE